MTPRTERSSSPPLRPRKRKRADGCEDACARCCEETAAFGRYVAARLQGLTPEIRAVAYSFIDCVFIVLSDHD